MDAVEEAIDYKAEGAIYWAHIGCRQACATIRSTKDALMEKAGIPTLVIDCDIADPSLTSEEEVRTKLEGFFEIMEGMRKWIGCRKTFWIIRRINFAVVSQSSRGPS
jgi:benzoyl-CoA reductase/2-hydroxyglutaryl-CoA dehydratase subunit BcrC/BadD/HgdB